MIFSHGMTLNQRMQKRYLSVLVISGVLSGLSVYTSILIFFLMTGVFTQSHYFYSSFYKTSLLDARKIQNFISLTEKTSESDDFLSDGLPYLSLLSVVVIVLVLTAVMCYRKKAKRKRSYHGKLAVTRVTTRMWISCIVIFMSSKTTQSWLQSTH